VIVYLDSSALAKRPVAFATFDRDLAAAARKEGLDIPLPLG
jgi:hypothetical protein